MMSRITVFLGAVFALLCGPLAHSAHAALTSASKVKITASAGKPDSDGKQVVTLMLKIEKPWHLYANPVGQEDFPGIPTTVSFPGKTATIEYPKGKKVPDPSDNKKFMNIYEGEITIKA